MIYQSAYLRLNPDERAGRAYHMGHRLCGTCHHRATRAGTLPFPAPPAPARRPGPKPTTGTALWWLARSDARRDMKHAGFAPTPRVCQHDNGISARRVIHDTPRSRWRTRTVKKQCRECGLHLGWDEPDNPTPCTAAELVVHQAPPPLVQPWTWGVMRYRRTRSPRRNKWIILEILPKQCPLGHPLDHATLTIGEWSTHHGSRTYTCHTCREFDHYIATWRPRSAKRRPARPPPHNQHARATCGAVARPVAPRHRRHLVEHGAPLPTQAPGIMINLADIDWVFARVLGDEIRQLRKRRGWIRRDLVDQLSEVISLQTLATYELGTRKITVARLLDICTALDTTPVELMQRAYRRWQADPDTTTGQTIDLYTTAQLETPELTPLRNWAITRLAELSDAPQTTAKTAWLTRPALQAMADLCGLDLNELIQQLPPCDLPAAGRPH